MISLRECVGQLIFLLPRTTGVERINLRNNVLLNSASTVNAVCNRNLVEIVCEPEESMTPVSNGGEVSTSTRCTIKNLDTNNRSGSIQSRLTKALSMALLQKQFRIKCDS